MLRVRGFNVCVEKDGKAFTASASECEGVVTVWIENNSKSGPVGNRSAEVVGATLLQELLLKANADWITIGVETVRDAPLVQSQTGRLRAPAGEAGPRSPHHSSRSSFASRRALRRALKAALPRFCVTLSRSARAASISASSSGVRITALSPGVGAACQGFQRGGRRTMS
jgi:hypothetical protein